MNKGKKKGRSIVPRPFRKVMVNSHVLSIPMLEANQKVGGSNVTVSQPITLSVGSA